MIMGNHISQSSIDDCCNLRDSYGMICVGCNCCGRIDKEQMYKSRYKVYVRQLFEEVGAFNDPNFQSNLQQRNIAINVIDYGQKIIDAVEHIDFGKPDWFEVKLDFDEVDWWHCGVCGKPVTGVEVEQNSCSNCGAIWTEKEDVESRPAVDAVPVVRCRYCSPEDCGGVEWDFEDLEITMSLQRGKLIICNSFGDEAEVPIRHCPICGAKMDGGEDDG